MSATQIRAAEVLLRKCVPDLSSTALTGPDGEGPVETKTTYEFVDAGPIPA